MNLLKTHFQFYLTLSTAARTINYKQAQQTTH